MTFLKSEYIVNLNFFQITFNKYVRACLWRINNYEASTTNEWQLWQTLRVLTYKQGIL